MFILYALISRVGIQTRRRRLTVFRRFVGRVTGALTILFTIGLTHGVAAEPVDARDFSQLSLEELLKAEITPINILGTHMHVGGEIMFGYRYSLERFRGNLDGTREVSAAEVFAQGYRLHHTWMDMQMQMIEAMYAPSDRWTIMGMGRFTQMEMGHIEKDGTAFASQSDGVGDTEVTAMYNLLGNPRGLGHRLLIKGGISLPTGAIDKMDSHNGQPPALLEYPMQLGSGTFDLLPGVTYIATTEHWSWGAEALGTVRLGENDRNYSLGDRYQLGAWGHYKITEWLGPSLRLEWRQWGNIQGADAGLNPTTNPAFDPKKQRGQRLDLLAGLHLYVNKGVMRGLRFSTEGGMAVYQDLAGPNLKSDWMINVNLNYVFR